MNDIAKCTNCGRREHLSLLDGKPPRDNPNSPNFTGLECIACYGEGWLPMSVDSFKHSVCRSLAEYYKQWRRGHGC